MHWRSGRSRLRILRLGVFAALAWGAAGASAEAQALSLSTGAALYDVDHLNAYTARIEWQSVYRDGNATFVCRGEGSAIFLGRNRFLTAAHVIDQNPFTDECAKAGIAAPVIEFGTTKLPARTLAVQPWEDEGGLAYADGVDLALVEVDGRMIQPELRTGSAHRLCAADLTEAGTEVTVSTVSGTYAARTQVSASLYSRVDFPAKRGDSGGGVFDKQRYCLLGIISSGGVAGANYVTTEVVRRFLDRLPASPARAASRARVFAH